MKTLVFIIFMTQLSLTFAGTGHSHGGGEVHSHGAEVISKTRSKEIGQKQVERLVKEKKIDSSWMFSTFDKSEKKKFKGKTEWLVTFENEKGVKGKKLYIFLSLTGEFIAANFTGK